MQNKGFNTNNLLSYGLIITNPHCYKSVTFMHYALQVVAGGSQPTFIQIKIVTVFALNENDALVNDKKYIVSMRLNTCRQKCCTFYGSPFVCPRIRIIPICGLPLNAQITQTA